jgi:hypothetical protein
VRFGSVRLSLTLTAANDRFCNEPLCQAAPFNPAAGTLLLSVVSLALPHHTIRGSGEPIFGA